MFKAFIRFLSENLHQKLLNISIRIYVPWVWLWKLADVCPSLFWWYFFPGHLRNYVLYFLFDARKTHPFYQLELFFGPSARALWSVETHFRRMKILLEIGLTWTPCFFFGRKCSFTVNVLGGYVATQRFFIFNPIWGNDPIWLIFFKWVGTTNPTRIWIIFGARNNGSYGVSFVKKRLFQGIIRNHVFHHLLMGGREG